MIKAIIFDLDDTLYEERTYVLDCFKEVSRHLSRKYSINWEKIYGEMVDILDKEGRGAIFNSICAKYNFKENIDNLVEVYRNNKPKIQLYEDAEEILKWAKEKGYKTGIITDGSSKTQWSKIEALNLKKKIDEIIVSDDLGRENWKPSHVPYKEIIKRLKINYDEAIYIGDNPNKDFIGAKRLGIKTVRVIRRSGDHMKTILDDLYEAEYTIRDSINEIRFLDDKERYLK